MRAWHSGRPFRRRADELEPARCLEQVKLPAILKTRRFGYDGKGQALVRSDADALRALQRLRDAPALLEGLVAFEREMSVIVVRGQDGEKHYYDLVENVHQNGILATSRVPARIPADVAYEARSIAGNIAKALDHVGVLAWRCSNAMASPLTSSLVNEIAPRVHNSGHWTLDACLVSQFENHVRAISGWPLGETARHSDAVMTNLIGDDVNVGGSSRQRGVALHLYGKAEARPGRKMGHAPASIRKADGDCRSLMVRSRHNLRLEP